MSAVLDATHDPALRSWVEGADGHADFPIQNLPFGVAQPGDAPAQGVVAIGDQLLLLGDALDARLFEGAARDAATLAARATLNDFMAAGAAPRRALRTALSTLLARGSAAETRARLCLRPAAECRMRLPARIGDYTDFYVGLHHAENVGRLFRPENPLLPNYKHVPIGYHGRASSVRVGEADPRRPRGQIKAPSDAAPRFAPSERLDFELELGLWIGPGNAPGEPIPVAQAADHIAGYCLLNDWSARDIQAWEYQPLGPFLGKSFATTISPWVVTQEAMAPFRASQPPRPEGDPAPLPHLWDAADQQGGALALGLSVTLQSAAMREAGLPPMLLARSDARHMYWTVAQLVAHHSSNGCDLHPGDLFGSGTISTPGPEGLGSLLEMTRGGAAPITLPSGETRRFLEDGDAVVLAARAEREGFVPIGFGPCRGVVRPA